MGYVKVKATVRNVYHPRLQTELELIADTGAIYTIINRKHLQTLKIKPTGKRQFKIADGKPILREVGIAQIEIDKEITHSIIVFGEPEDAQVLGVTTLEELGLQVDPVNGKLKPLELLLLYKSPKTTLHSTQQPQTHQKHTLNHPKQHNKSPETVETHHIPTSNTVSKQQPNKKYTVKTKQNKRNSLS